MKILLLRCPKCKQKMKYASRDGTPKQKRCVYCGHSFKAGKHVLFLDDK
jgi:hypothetical protein